MLDENESAGRGHDVNTAPESDPKPPAHARRIAIEPFPCEPVSLVDMNGEWQADFEMDLDDDALKDCYRKLVTARALDERLGVLQRSGRISFVAPAAGHEGAQIGIAKAMRPGHDWLFPYYRDSGLALALGMPPAQMFAQHMGTGADLAKARQMPCHPGSSELRIFTVVSSIACQIPPAVGMALAAKLRGSDEVVVTTFGDGATSEGDWHAAVNLAAARMAPVVFACENNRYAISVDFATQTRSPSICERARAYGIPGYRADGMDVLSVYYVMQEVLRRTRTGEGPAIVEFDVCRYGPHSSADDDSVYRSRDEIEVWKQRDPIVRMRRFLERRQLWDDAREEHLKARIKAEFEQAVEQAQAATAPTVDSMFDDVYAERFWHLEQQAGRLQREL